MATTTINRDELLTQSFVVFRSESFTDTFYVRIQQDWGLPELYEENLVALTRKDALSLIAQLTARLAE